MKEKINEFLSMKSFAVAGSFKDEKKYAYQIFRKLRANGREVYPVNPGIKEVDGVKVYPDISAIGAVPDVANLVTSPAVSLKTVQKCKELGIKKIWFQPGAESIEALEFCEKNGMSAIHGICVLIESK